jgi:hypothetical protein
MNEKNLLSTLRHEMQYNFSRLQKQINGDEVETLNRGCEIPSWRDVKNYDESTYLGADDLKGCLILHNDAPEDDEVSSYSLILTGKGETRYVLPIDLAHMGVVE